jgi:hypothetical protein
MWHKTGIQLPPGWHDGMARLAREVGLPIRYVYMVAVDAALNMDLEQLKARGRKLRDLGDDSFQELVKQNCKDPHVLGKIAAGSGSDVRPAIAADSA